MSRTQFLKESLFRLLPVAIQDHWYRRNAGASAPFVWHFPEHGLLYVQVSKVATRSIRNALGHWALPELPIGWEAGREGARRFGRHMTPAQVLRQSRPIFRFAFVRNPLARLVSCYRDKIATVGAKARAQERIHRVYRAYGIEPGMPFSEFVRRVAAVPDSLADPHIRSQHLFLYVEGVPAVDFIGRFEQLGQGWEILQQKFSLPDLPHYNSSGDHLSWARYYDDQSYRMAARRYAEDIEILGYQNPAGDPAGTRCKSARFA